MIIIPIEKKFDWKRAPLALFAVVFLNILIFFVYQSGDPKKLESALGRYMERGYLDKEWPIIQEYLEQKEDNDTLSRANTLKEEGNLTELHLLVLGRADIYEHLLAESRNHFYDDYYITWLRDRQSLQDTFNSMSVYALGLKPNDLNPLHLLTYQFLHGSIMHLLGNMIFIVVFGFAVEACIGHWRFIAFYLTSGVVGGVFHVLVQSNSYAPLVGASGALAGLMAMYLAIFRLQKIEFFYWVLFFVGYFKAPALAIFPLYLLKELYLYFSSPESSVAFMAHAGGLLAGAALMVGSLKFDKNLLDQEYIEEDQSVDPKQAALADIYAALGQFQYEKTMALVTATLQKWPADFDLKWLHYRIGKILKDETYQQSFLSLLACKRLSVEEAEKVERAWVENPSLQDQIDTSTLLQFGMEMSAAGCLSTAENIFERVNGEQADSVTLGILAKKLANSFADRNERSKQAKYQSISDQLLQN